MRITAAALAVAAAAGLVTGCGSASGSGHGRARVQVDLLDCGKGWSPTTTGTFHLAFANTDTQNGEARIVGTGGTSSPRGAVFADIEPLAAGSTANLDLALGPGSYAVQCLFEASSAITGSTLHLTGDAPLAAARGVTAVTLADLAGPIRTYQTWVSSQLPALGRDVSRMRDRLAAGDRAGAQAAWRSGHARYERLGAAYDAFGDLDGAINGLPDGLPGGVRDPGWTGFHAIEHGLWGSASPQSLVALAGTLSRDVGKLAATMELPPSENPKDSEIKVDPGAIDALTFSIRAHEISENALQLSLNGKDDFGAHASLATVAANLDGTEQVLRIMGPLLAGRIDRGPIDAGVARVRAALAAAGGADVRTLPRATRERVDAAVSELTELLAPVAVVLEPRRAS